MIVFFLIGWLLWPIRKASRRYDAEEEHGHDASTQDPSENTDAQLGECDNDYLEIAPDGTITDRNTSSWKINIDPCAFAVSLVRRLAACSVSFKVLLGATRVVEFEEKFSI